MGDTTLIDGMVYDGLTCSFTNVHMGVYGNSTAEDLNLSREEQDRWAARSQELAIKAIESGITKEEIVSVEVKGRKGEKTIIEQDESPRKGTTVESLNDLKPVFGRDGTITAGNAPGVNDGACAMLIMSDERAKKKKGSLHLQRLLVMNVLLWNQRIFRKHRVWSLTNFLIKRLCP